ncbi:MAG TPA: transposase [Pirellulales bacterium]|nr:transposase [Pirellulales bacterium]
MNEREQRGLMIAASCRIKKRGQVWLVPSQAVNGKKYTVSLDSEQPHCTCPDHETRGCLCKHIYAARIVYEREYSDDGVMMTETESLTIQTTRKTYPQNWTAYNTAQTGEKATLQVLLHELCSGIPQPKAGIGPPRLPIGDAIFVACFKVYSMLSGRRCISDLCDAQAKGYIRRVPHFNSIFNVFDAPGTGTILTRLIAQSAAPLAALESKFAVDSSGFSGCKFDRWYDYRWGGEIKEMRSWVKCHAMIGCLTNVVTACEVLDKESADSPMLKPLMNETAKQFKIGDLCADAAYLSENNLQSIADIGGSGFIAFKRNSTASRPGVWNKSFHLFNLHREEFLARYHQRSNIESTFSMIKRKFGDSVRSKGDLAMKNEVLAKVLCHNLCCLIQSMEEFGLCIISHVKPQNDEDCSGAVATDRDGTIVFVQSRLTTIHMYISRSRLCQGVQRGTFPAYSSTRQRVLFRIR